MSERKPLEYTTVKITVKAAVQDNGDGTWSAFAYSNSTPPLVRTANSRSKALELAAQAASVHLGISL